LGLLTCTVEWVAVAPRIELATLGFSQRIDGVIVAPKAAMIWLSPIPASDSRSSILEAELVTVMNRHNGYLWVATRDKQFGWVHADEVAPVIAGNFDQKDGP
jgi:hypothetical protein